MKSEFDPQREAELLPLIPAQTGSVAALTPDKRAAELRDAPLRQIDEILNQTAGSVCAFYA